MATSVSEGTNRTTGLRAVVDQTAGDVIGIGPVEAILVSLGRNDDAPRDRPEGVVNASGVGR